MSNAVYIGSDNASLPAVSLPDGYTQLAYVEANGAQYVNTGFQPDNNTRVVCDVAFPVTDLGAWLFGARPGGGQYCFLSYQNEYRSDYANSTDDEKISFVPGGRFTVDKNKNVTYINGEVARTAAQATFSCQQNLYLFACNQSGVANGYGSLKLYSCKIYDNDILVRDYVPCRSAQNEVGLYDLVNDAFSASGSAALLASPLDDVARKVTALYVGVNGLARKVVKGYIGAGGLARQFYSAAQPFAYAYTGAYTESELTIDGVVYTMLTLTSSGTLSVTRAISADVWLCGGGGNGGDTSQTVQGAGGGGGGYIASANVQLSGNVACVVGAAAGATSLGSTVANAGGNGSGANGGNGASGGGSGGTLQAPGTGAGVSTIPVDFGITNAHCAGGGGGAGIWSGFPSFSGGAGGSNGTNGGNNTTVSSGPVYGGSGGEKGGGGGGLASNAAVSINNGGNATFYGSAGGGGGSYVSSVIMFGMGGSGYQGVIYIRWKKEDAA